MKIVPLAAKADLGTLGSALRHTKLISQPDQHFAFVKSSGEGGETTYLVSAASGDKDVDMLKLAVARDQRITFAVTDGVEPRTVTGTIARYVEPGRGWDRQIWAAALPIAVGATAAAALYGALEYRDFGMLLAGIVGWAVSFPLAFQAIEAQPLGHDWARELVESHYDGSPAEAVVQRLDVTPAPLVALPPPTEAPMAIPAVSLPVREKVTA